MKNKVFLSVMIASMMAMSCTVVNATPQVVQEDSGTEQEKRMKPENKKTNEGLGEKDKIELAENQELVMGKVKEITSTTITFYVGTDTVTKPQGEKVSTAARELEKKTTKPSTKLDNEGTQTGMSDNMGPAGMTMTWSDTTQTLTLGSSVTVNRMGGEDASTALTYQDIKVDDQVRLIVETDATTQAKTVVAIEIGVDMNKRPEALGNNKDGNKTGQNDSGTITGTATYLVDAKAETQNGKNYNATQVNESAVKAMNGGSVTLTKATITKTGNSEVTEESDFYGLNAAVLATKSSSISLSNATITTNAEGANAVFATQEGSHITLKDIKIVTKADASRGLDATYGGTVTATNVDITTSGEHCAALATDRGEGTITLTGGILQTAGDGSPCIYSTGNITANNVTGVATGAQAAVIEGKNSITLNNSTLTGAGRAGVMLYQSFSGDAGIGTSVFTMTNGALTATTGPVFFVTNTQAIVNLENVTLKGVAELISAGIARWGNEGSNGGHLTFNAKKQELKGAIVANEISTVAVNLTESSTLKSTINADHTAQSLSLSLDATSKWEVTGDSYLTIIKDEDVTLKNIDDNGFTIYYDSTQEDNAWLSGKTVTLPDGGKLTPLK